jgi:hypothetical protein
MRFLFIICEASVEHRVTDMLDALGCPGYTRFTGAMGSGKRGPREGTPVWPGLNSVIMAGMPEAQVPDVIQGLQDLETERQGRLAIKVFSTAAEEYM